MAYGALLLGAPRVALPLASVNTGGRARRSSIVQVQAHVGGSAVGLEAEEKSREVKDEPRVLLKDVRQWGIGSGPIFTIVRSSDGGVAKVSVDEEEIIVRCGFQSMVSQQSYDVSERISMARRIAQEIELGRLEPPADSLLFKYVEREEETPSDNRLQRSDESTEAFQMNEQSQVTRDDSFIRANELALVNIRAVKPSKLAETPSLGIKSARPFFIVVGLAASLAMRMTDFLKGRASKPVGSTSDTKDVKQTLVGADDEERLTKIREMAKQVEEKEKSRLVDKEGVATARDPLVKKQRQAGNQGVDVFALAQQLDEVRRAGRDETFSLENIPGGSTNGNSRAQVKAVQNAKDGSTGGGSVRKRAMPRIITSYKEALEVLAERKLRDRRRLESGKDTKPPGPAAHDGSDLVKSLESNDTAEQSDQTKRQAETLVTKGDKAVDYALWKEDDVFRDILLKARENDRVGKELFYGMSPDAKEILFKGLEKELGKEAEPIKAWITERTAGSAKALKEADGATRTEESLIIPKYIVEKQPQPEDKPQRTIVTTGGGGAAAKSQETSSARKPLKPNKKKVWPKELQRRYDAETDPKTRRLLKEIGKDLDEWIPEETVAADEKLFNQGPEGRLELLRRWHAELKAEARQKGADPFDTSDVNPTRYEKMQERIQKWTDMFGPNALIDKYRDFKPAKPDTLWWLDLRYVACIMLKNDEQKMAPGLYSMNMALESEKQVRMHVVGFEEQKDALNFCRIMVPELDELGGATGAGIIPFEPKELLKEAKSGGFKVTVVKKGQVELYAGKPLEEVEARILEIGRDVYVEEQLRERSIDIKAVMEDLGRDL